ncbi:hypothetical protein ACXYL9_03525 [Qipengyuania sp. CAU 1752]
MTGLLVTIGLTMSNPAGPASYALPLQVSGIAVLAIFVAYWRLAKRIVRPREGAIWTGAMAGIALLLWIPLVSDPLLLREHGKVLAIWTAIWGISALPLLRAAVKGLRVPQA